MVSLFKRLRRTAEVPMDFTDDIPLFAADGLSNLETYQGYASAEPYPHLVLDDLFNPAALHAILREWPQTIDDTVNAFDDGTYVARKLSTTWRTRFGRHTRNAFVELSSPPFLMALEKVTGISGLLPDPYFFGGGLHATAAGGKLAVHADYNKHPITRLDRRLNLLIYLNEGWSEDNAGWLELWDREMQRCVRRVLPVFNRSVLFSTTSESFHGQPEPIAGPPDLWRRSIALYYFTNARPETSVEHSTVWRERPSQGF